MTSNNGRNRNTQAKNIEKAMNPDGEIATRPPTGIQAQPASTPKDDVEIRARRPDGPITTKPPSRDQTPEPKKSS